MPICDTGTYAQVKLRSILAARAAVKQPIVTDLISSYKPSIKIDGS